VAYVLHYSSWDSTGEYGIKTKRTYDPQGSISKLPRASGRYDGEDNLKSITDSVTGKWSYTNDNLNRLISGTASVGYYSGAQVVEAHIDVEALAPVEIGVGRGAGRGDQVAEGVILLGVGDSAGGVGQYPHRAATVVLVETGGLHS